VIAAGVLAEMASNKSDRSMSPSTISEEGRRELIARQHRALYGSDGQPQFNQTGFPEEQQAANSKTIGGRGSSDRSMDPFGATGQPQQAVEGGATGQVDKNPSPAGQGPPGFNKAPTPPTADEASHSRQLSKSTTAPVAGGMAPIGSRPSGQQPPGQNLNKRTTSPLPAGMPYTFGAAEQNNERAGSSHSNNNTTQKDNGQNPGMATWGTGSGVWGSNKIGTTSVWG
jgi:hypothetical protein